MELSSHLLSCIPSVSVLLLVSDSPYLLSFVLVYAFALGSRCILLLGVRLAPILVARSHSFYPRGPVVLGEMLLLLSLFFTVCIITSLALN